MTRADDPAWSRPAHGSAWEATPDATAGGLPLDRYVSLGRVGQGATGVVEALYDRWLGREVARKLPAAGLDPDLAEALLDHEARITAYLDHPHVVAVHDAGVTDDGQRFFTMRLVRGETLADRLARPRASDDPSGWVRRLHDACLGIAHAHTRGVVHGDLKPTNVLVGPLGDTQVADWGLARRVGPEPLVPPVAPGAGTPPWRAPEVERGETPGPAADVYALGVILREVLSGDPRRAPDDAPVELLAVLRRATEPDPARRYPDAAALADELGRWLDGRPVQAHAYRPLELLARLLRAWRVPLTVATVATVALAAVAGGAAHRLRQERDRARIAEAQARDAAATLWRDRAIAALVADDRPGAEEAARQALALRPDPQARGVLAAFGAAPAARRTGPTVSLPCEAWIRLDADGGWCGDGRSLIRVGRAGASEGSWPLAATDAARTASGEVVATVAAEAVHLDPRTGRTTHRRPVPGATPLVPGGDGVIVARLHAVDLADPEHPWAPCPSPDTLDTVLVDGTTWWTACSHGQVARRDPDGRTHLLADVGPPLARVTALVRHGDLLLAGTLDGAIVAVSPTDGTVRWRAQAGTAAIRAVRRSDAHDVGVLVDVHGRATPVHLGAQRVLDRLDVHGVRDAWLDGASLRVATAAGLEAWTVDPLAGPSAWREDEGVSALAVHPAGSELAVGVGATVVRRALPTALPAGPPTPHGRLVKSLAYTADGGALLTGSMDDPHGLIWARSGGPTDRLAVPRIRRVTAVGDGFVAATFAPYAWVGHPGEDPRRLPTTQPLIDLATPPLDGRVWGIDETGGVWEIDPVRSEVSLRWSIPGGERLALSAARPVIAVADAHTVHVVDPAEGTVRAQWTLPTVLTALAVSPAGDRVAAGTLDGQVHLWTVDGRLLAEAPGHDQRVSAIGFTAEDAWISTGWDGRVRRWRLDR